MGICVVAVSAIGGSGPVGARRMMRVRASEGVEVGSEAEVGSEVFSRAGGSLGAVTGQPA
ncbi:hypothetical protein AWC13_01580 [Mycobacterium kubicae]|nr:hypothetical protein AWC13_01580 [Mycobacterium kubicae]